MIVRGRELAQWLRVPKVALSEDSRSIPSTTSLLTNTDYSISRESDALFWLLQGPETHDSQTSMQVKLP